LSVIRQGVDLVRVLPTFPFRVDKNAERRKWNSPRSVCPIYECRYDERLKTKSEKSTRLSYTGLFGELEHLKIEPRLKDEMFAEQMKVIYY
jgi:hypothetical protein